jgi:hypothetical protein
MQRRPKGGSARWIKTLLLIGLGGTILAGLAVFFLMQPPDVNALPLVTITYQAASRKFDPERRQDVWLDAQREGGIGIFVGDNEVLTCACAAGWRPYPPNRMAPSLSDYLLDPAEEETELPTRWWVRWKQQQHEAYPILVMPKGYSVVVLRVEGLSVRHFVPIASVRPKASAMVWVVGNRNSAGAVSKLVVQVSEQRHQRTFFRQDTRTELTLWLTILEAPSQTQAPTQPSQQPSSHLPFFLEGAPVFNMRKELCGVLHSIPWSNGQSFCWIMEPLSEVKDDIEAALQR